MLSCAYTRQAVACVSSFEKTIFFLYMQIRALSNIQKMKQIPFLAIKVYDATLIIAAGKITNCIGSFFVCDHGSTCFKDTMDGGNKSKKTHGAIMSGSGFQ